MISELDKGKIYTRVDFIRKFDAIDKVFRQLENQGQLILIGGAIRDILNDKIPKDWDIVVKSPNVVLECPDKSFVVERNSFGGLKLRSSEIIFDIWSINSHWGFINNPYEVKDENLIRTIFFNIDCLYINLTTGKGDFFPYNTALDKKLLDINLDNKHISKNPCQEVLVLKAFVYEKKYDMRFSEKLRGFVNRWFEETSSPYEVLKATAEKRNIDVRCLNIRRVDI